MVFDRALTIKLYGEYNIFQVIEKCWPCVLDIDPAYNLERNASSILRLLRHSLASKEGNDT